MIGYQIRTVNHTIDYYWPLSSKAKDDAFSRSVALWIDKNERTLNKAQPIDCCRLLAEQFPDLALIEIRHAHGWLGRWAK